MRASALAAAGGLAAALALTGCYVDPDGLDPATVLALRVDAPEAAADGVTTADVVLTFSDRATAGVPVLLRASAGEWWAGDTQPDGVRVRVPAGATDGAKTLVVPLGLPRTPGPLRIEADLGGVIATARVTVPAALPDRVVAGTNRVALLADGQSTARLTFDLERAVGRPSVGTRLALAACCLGSDDQPTACPFAAPLRLPTSVRLAAGADSDRLTVDVVGEPLTAAQLPSGALALAVVARARAPEDASGAACGSLSGVSAVVPLTLQQPDAAAAE